MKYENIKTYSDEQFRRITGVKRETFDKMLKILEPKYREKFAKGGRPPKLSLPEMLLAALEYWREYRTYAHIAASFGIHESNIYRLMKNPDPRVGVLHFPIMTHSILKVNALILF